MRTGRLFTHLSRSCTPYTPRSGVRNQYKDVLGSRVPLVFKSFSQHSTFFSPSTKTRIFPRVKMTAAAATTSTSTMPSQSRLHLQAGSNSKAYTLLAESAPQSHTLMAFPSLESADNEEHCKLLQNEVVNIANNIARFQPVHLYARSHLVDQAKAMVNSNVLVEEAGADQLWIRDSGPIYVQNTQESQRTAINFNFNYWGDKLPRTGDEHLAQEIINQVGEPSVKSRVTLEGGAVEHDGEGTFLATESSIINDNRNPDLTKDEIEAELKALFGVNHFIWVPGIKGYDITDFHIDAFARFTSPGTVLLSKPAPNADATLHKAYEEAREILVNSKDAKGRQLVLHDCEEPDTKQMGLPGDHQNEVVASYANYLLVNGAVMLPKFGQDRVDTEALQLFRELFPSREVVQVPINILPRTGGGIHCSTQHVPL